MSRSIEPTFRLKDVSLNNLDSITIENVSADRSYGRRFHVKCGDGETGDLVFKKVFAKIKSISKQAHSTEDLRKVIDILAKLKTMEAASIEEYKEKDCGYRFRTWFHRLFTFGSHLDKIITLKADVLARYDVQFEVEKQLAEEQETARIAAENRLALEKIYIEPLKLSRDANPEPFKKDELVTFHEGLSSTSFLDHISWSRGNQTYQITARDDSLEIENSENKLICVFRNGVVSEMRNNDVIVDSIPEEWQIPLRMAFIEHKQSLCSYNYGSYNIIKSSLSEFPEWHLHQWCQAVIKPQYSDNRDFEINYKNDNNTEQDGIDVGGLRRDYFASLFEAVLDETSLFGTLESSLKLPRIERDLIFTGIPFCSHAEKEVYHDLGSLMWYSFNSQPQSTGTDRGAFSTGVHFSDALFRGVLSLSESEIQTPFKDLPIQTHIKMVRAILEEWRDETKSVLDTTYKCLDHLDAEKMDACIAENGRLLSTLIGAAELNDYMDAAEYNEHTEQFGAVDIDKVRANPDEFKKQFEIGFFKNKNLLPEYLNGASLGSLLAPIHSIAQGMHAAAGAESWNTKIIVSEVSALSAKIQGTISREALIQGLDTEYYSPVIRIKLQWLKDWIADPTTTDLEVRQFVKFSTGTSGLPNGKTIKISGGASGPIPMAHTCSFRVDITRDMDGIPEGSTYFDGTYEKFIRCVKEAIVNTNVDYE